MFIEKISFKGSDEITLKNASGETKAIKIDDLRYQVETCCKDLEDVSADLIVQESLKNYYKGMTEEEVSLSNIMATRALIEKEPNYSLVAARLLLFQLYHEAIGQSVSFDEAKIE